MASRSVGRRTYLDDDGGDSFDARAARRAPRARPGTDGRPTLRDGSEKRWSLAQSAAETRGPEPREGEPLKSGTNVVPASRSAEDLEDEGRRRPREDAGRGPLAELRVEGEDAPAALGEGQARGDGDLAAERDAAEPERRHLGALAADDREAVDDGGDRDAAVVARALGLDEDLRQRLARRRVRVQHELASAALDVRVADADAEAWAGRGRFDARVRARGPEGTPSTLRDGSER